MRIITFFLTFFFLVTASFAHAQSTPVHLWSALSTGMTPEEVGAEMAKISVKLKIKYEKKNSKITGIKTLYGVNYGGKFSKMDFIFDEGAGLSELVISPYSTEDICLSEIYKSVADYRDLFSIKYSGNIFPEISEENFAEQMKKIKLIRIKEVSEMFDNTRVNVIYSPQGYDYSKSKFQLKSRYYGFTEGGVQISMRIDYRFVDAEFTGGVMGAMYPLGRFYQECFSDAGIRGSVTIMYRSKAVFDQKNLDAELSKKKSQDAATVAANEDSKLKAEERIKNANGL